MNNVFIRTTFKGRTSIKFVPKEEVQQTIERFTTLRTLGKLGNVELVEAETPQAAYLSTNKLSIQ